MEEYDVIVYGTLDKLIVLPRSRLKLLDLKTDE